MYTKGNSYYKLSKLKLVGCTTFILFATSSLAGCWFTAATTGAQVVYNHNSIEQSFSNQKTSFNVSQAFDNDPTLKNKINVSVTATSNIILLTGQVPSQTAKDKVESLANKYSDSRRVINELEIGPPIDDEQNTKDAWITTKIRSQILASSGITPGDFKVITENGTVYLLGASTPDQVDKVVDIAKNTDGVKKVVKLIYYVHFSTTG